MGEQWKQWWTLFSWASRSLQMVTAAMKLKDSCSLEDKYDKPRQHIKKQRHCFVIKVPLVKGMVFSVVMYKYENWSIKKVGHQRIDALKLYCSRRLLRVSWTARRSSQSILKEINPEYLLEGLILMLKLQYFGYLIRRPYSFEKTLMLGRFESRRRRGQERIKWLDDVTDSMNMS